MKVLFRKHPPFSSFDGSSWRMQGEARGQQEHSVTGDGLLN